MRCRPISLELLQNFRRSIVLQHIAADEKRLRHMVKNDLRKIIPVAEVARWLGVSNRQLWNWIEQGWINTYKRPSESYKKGISKPGFSRFLKRLAEYQRFATGMCSPLGLGRPPAARNQLKDAYLSDQLRDGMTAGQCAEALGISTDSVLRALRKGYVRSFKVSPWRYRLGDRRKVKQAKKNLTVVLPK